MDISTSFSSAAGADHAAPWPRDRFYDRAGRAISIERWAQLHANDGYPVIGDWRDDNGSAVRTVWTGINLNYGESETLIFQTDCLVGDDSCYYTYCTEADARQGHDDAVRRIVRKSGADATSVASRPMGPRLDFYDRQGNSITMAQWERLRRDPNYCLIGQWLGEGGAHVEVYWTGFDRLGGFPTRPTIFGLCVAAFENCPLPDSTYRFYTEARAKDHFSRIIPLVECGIHPWDDDRVAAAGFDPLVLKAW